MFRHSIRWGAASVGFVMLAFACGESGKSGGATSADGGTGATSGMGASSTGAAAGTPGSGGTMVEPVSESLSVSRLRAEYRIDPIGIHVDEPRLDWLLESETRGEKQTAYRILVASSLATLDQDQGDLWDTGKITSDETVQIVYEGDFIEARQRAYWKVRAWDQHDVPTAWSEPAFWEKGLERDDWEAQWITSSTTTADLSGAQWIWFDEGDPISSAPAGERFFRKTFSIAGGVEIDGATLAITADDEFELFVNGTSLGLHTTWQDVKLLDIEQHLTAGENTLAVRAINGSTSPAGLIANLVVGLSSGSDVSVITDASWKANQSSATDWHTSGFDDSSWAAARNLASFGGGPWGTPAAPSAPAYFRKEFSASNIKRARLYATSLGIYELWLNGQRVGDDYLAPGFTDYRKRVQVQTYDVTDLVQEGDNAIGAILADGWFNGKYFVFGRGDFFGSGPNRLLAQLELELEDGSRKIVATEATGPDAWKVGSGPVRAADILDGETYDARLEQDGWAEPGFDDAAWQEPDLHVDVEDHYLVADVTDHVQKVEEIAPIAVIEQSPGVYVYDLGQNMVGVARLRVTGERGARIQLRHAEVLNGDGSIYTTNLRSARATDVYTLRGDGEEVYEPRFTFHGFRYLELSGDIDALSEAPSLSTVTGVVMHSRMTPTGSFETSAPMVNQLQKNIVWGQRGNFVSVPTDCPQRDERQGWLGDAQVFVKTSTFNMDVASFFTKWMNDVTDAQGSNGSFSEIAPNPDWNNSTPAWGDAGVIVPWTIYLAYGDERILDENYYAMKEWVDYVHGQNPDLLWVNSTGSNYGDWLSIDADTDKGVLATSFFAHSADLVARTARILGEDADATKYDALFEAIKQAYDDAYVSDDGKIQSETQTAYSLALRFELLPENLRAAAAEHLAADVEARGVLTTGFIGVAHLLPALTMGGRLDLAYMLLQNEAYPSWMYSINKGATTIWERWDGIMENGNFQTPGMNSFNHYSFGAVGDWMYSTIAGIELDESAPGYEHIIIRPRPGGGLTHASGSLDTIRGTVSTEWTLESDTFTLSVTVPVSATASVYLPFDGDVRESGEPITPETDGSYLVESGSYVFSVAAN